MRPLNALPKFEWETSDFFYFIIIQYVNEFIQIEMLTISRENRKNNRFQLSKDDSRKHFSIFMNVT